MPRAVVAHGTEDVPRFFYGNRLALELFAMRAGQFIGLPSHESAEAGLRDENGARHGQAATFADWTPV